MTGKKHIIEDSIFTVIVLSAMFLVNLFSWKFSSISMMLVAAVVSLICFVIQDAKKGGKA